MSHEFTPTGEGPKNNKLDTKPEQQVAPANSFDTKIKRLFSEKVEGDSRRNRQPATPSKLEDLNNFLADEDRFTDGWWENLYEWLDQNDFHREKYSIAQITFESLDTLPPTAKLPDAIAHWISNLNGWLEEEPERKQVSEALGNSSIPISLRRQLGEYVARANVGIYGLDLKMQSYRIFGQDIGELAINEMFALISRSIVDEKFESYRGDFVRLYELFNIKQSKKTSTTGKLIKKLFFIPKVRDRLSSKSHHESQSQTDSGHTYQKELAEKRVNLIRDIILEVIPPALEVVDKSRPWERKMKFDRYIDINSNNHQVSKSMSTLPLKTLEKYLFELRRLKSILPEFLNLAGNLFSRKGLVPPLVALGEASQSWTPEEYIPIRSILDCLDGLKESGSLDDSMLDEVLIGMNKHSFSDDETRILARRNLRILLSYQLPQNTRAYDIPRLLTIPEEDNFNNRIKILKSITTAYENHEETFIPVVRLVYAGSLSGERALQLPIQANDVLENPSLFSLAILYPQTFLASDEHTKFFRKIVTTYFNNEQHIKDIAKAVQENHINRDMALAFPQHANIFMDDKMKETRLFIWNNGKTILKDDSDLKFLNRLVGEFGQKADSLIRGYQECLEAGIVTTEEKELVLEFAKQFRVVAPATLAGYKEAKQGGFEKGYVAQLKTLAEKMTGSGIITDEERKKPYYKDLLKHVYSNNSGQWSSFKSNDSCADRSSDLANFKINPRYEIDLLSQSEIRIKAGETPNLSVQDEVQQPILEIAKRMDYLGHDKEKINLALKEDVDKTLKEITENNGLQGIDIDSLTSNEEKMFLILTDAVYGTRSIDPKKIKDLVATYEFATFEDISDYMAGTRDRVSRANNQDYALLCEVGAFYSDRIKEVNRRLVEEAYKNPQIVALMPEYFRKLSQESTATQKQDRINRLQVERLGASESFVKQLTRVLEKRRGRKYEPEKVREIIRRYEGATGGLQEKTSSSQNSQTRAFYGQLRSQRERTFEALQLISGEKVDPQRVHLGEINLQQALDTETGIREGKYDEDQFASYTAQRFIDIFEDERIKIEGELAKFESITGKEREVLYGYITKTKESANARMVGGVCVAGDNPSKNKDQNMWDMPNYFQLVLQEPDTLQCQGLVLLHHFTQDGKKVLAVSLNPSSTYLYSVDETALFNGIMGTLEQFANDNNMDMITFSQDRTIRTNRTGGQFEKTMDERVASVNKKFRFSSPQTFSYSPIYQLQDMDIVWERKA